MLQESTGSAKFASMGDFRMGTYRYKLIGSCCYMGSIGRSKGQKYSPPTISVTIVRR
jgi:hypothetical protein